LRPLAFDPEIVEQWRSRSGDQLAKQLGGQEAERDPIAVAIRSKDAFHARDGADQREARWKFPQQFESASVPLTTYAKFGSGRALLLSSQTRFGWTNISPSHRRCQLVAISNIPLATKQPALKALRAF
jgi:hypothetical protein